MMDWMVDGGAKTRLSSCRAGRSALNTTWNA